MSVVLSMEEVGPCRQQLEIEVPKAAVDAETERVVKGYRKQVRISGFRQGKAPKSLVLRQCSSDIRQDVLDRLVPRYWRQAEAEKELDSLLDPQLKSVDFDLGGEMKFVAIVEVRPEIVLGEIDTFDFPVVATEPNDEEVKAEVTSIRSRFGDWKEVDRSAAQGDLVTIHVRKGDAEEEDPLTLEVGEARVWEEISLAVTGLKAGQKSTFDRVEGEDVEKVHYSIRLEKVEEKVLPDLTDEWVKEFTQLEGIDDLNDKIRTGIANRMAETARRTRHDALVQQLRDRHPITVPEGVVHEQIESMMRGYAENLARQGVDVEKAELDWADLAEKFKAQAERVVHGELVLDAIAAERKIEAPAEKLESVLAEIAASQKTSTLAVRRALDSEGRLEKLRRELRREHVVSILAGDAEGAGEATEEPVKAKAKKKAPAKKKVAAKKKAPAKKKADAKSADEKTPVKKRTTKKAPVKTKAPKAGVKEKASKGSE